MKQFKTSKKIDGHTMHYELFENETSYVSPKRVSIEQRRALREASRELFEENVFSLLPSRGSSR